MNSYFPAPPATWDAPSLDELLGGAFQTFPLGLGILSPGGEWIMVNPALCALLETPPRELSDLPLEAKLIESHAPQITRVLEQFEDRKRDSYTGEVRFYTRDGQIKKAKLAISAARSSTQTGRETARFLLLQMSEIAGEDHGSELLELENEKTLLEARASFLEQQLETLQAQTLQAQTLQAQTLQAQTLQAQTLQAQTASTPVPASVAPVEPLTQPLTGFYGRIHLEAMLATETHRCARTGDRFCVLTLRLGKQSEQNLLRASDILRARLRRSDVAFDLGGGDFAAILPSTSDAGGQVLAETFARKLKEFGTIQTRCAQWDGLESSDELLQRALSETKK